MSFKKTGLFVLGGVVLAGAAGKAFYDKNKEVISEALEEAKALANRPRKEKLEDLKGDLEKIIDVVDNQIELEESKEVELLDVGTEEDIARQEELEQELMNIINELEARDEIRIQMSDETLKEKLEFLNTASHEELMTLPRVGDATAQSIIEGRPYHNQEDVKLLERIPYIVSDLEFELNLEEDVEE